MNVGNIKVGQVFKNYKDLCKALELEPRGKAGSNSRKAQEKEIKRYFNYNKMEGSNKIMVYDVYNEIKEKVKKVSNNAKYVENIETIVLYTLNKHSEETLILSRGRLLELCNMINDNYRVGKNRVSKISALTEIEVEHIYNFYSNSNAMLTKSIVSALKSLRGRRLIDYYDTIMLCKNVTVPVITEDGDLEFAPTGEYSYVEANIEERKLILKYERVAMARLGCKKIQDIVIQGKWKEFKSMIESLLRENYDKNLNYYYSAYKLIYNEEHIKEEITALELESSKRELNNKVSSSLEKSTKTRHTKSINKNNAIGNLEPIESKSDYVSKQLTLLDLLVKENPTNNI